MTVGPEAASAVRSAPSNAPSVSTRTPRAPHARAAAAKSSDTYWTRNSSFYDAGHLCRIWHKVVPKAAEAARDRTTPKAPNRLHLDHLPPRAEFPDESAFRPMAGNVAIR